MPTSGVRIPIKLPWKGATDKKDQFVSMKQPVADFFGFDKAKKDELLYETTVQKKDESPDKETKGTVKVKRRRRPGYRQRAVRVIFQTGRKGTNSRANTETGAKVKIGKKEYKSLQFPITTSTPITEVVEYFESGAGKKLKALRVVEANTGQGYPVIPD